tara:strand:- start:5846 stop:6220 length:375 start_codon:yes stop_codon:yes gene_type:complete
MIIAKLYQCVYNAIISLCLKCKNKEGKMYYNTTNQNGSLLRTNMKQANNQEQLTLAVFQTYPNDNLSANDVWRFLIENESINEQTPLTSIRRAITDLTNRNRLVKTDKKVLGNAGRKTYTWRLK